MRVNLLTFFLILLIGFCKEGSSNIPCNLRTWEVASPGKTIGANFLNLGGITSKSYVVRTTDGANKIGTLVVTGDSQETYVPGDDGNSSLIISYEVLTNLEGCQIVWSEVDSKPEFGMLTPSKLYYGMIAKEGTYFVGEVNFTAKPPELTVAFPEGTETLNSSFYVAESSSPGLKVVLTDVVIPPDPSSNNGAVVAIEEIRNYADVEIEQSFQHIESLTTVTTNVVQQKYTSTHVVSGGLDLIVFGATMKVESTYTKEITESWTIERTTEISVKRTIMVPPNTAVRACSTVAMRSNFTVDYNATAVYTAPGLTPEEIVILLKTSDDPITGVFVDDKDRAVLKNVMCSLSGNFVMDSSFLVIDLSVSDEADCLVEEQRMKHLKEKNKQINIEK